MNTEKTVHEITAEIIKEVGNHYTSSPLKDTQSLILQALTQERTKRDEMVKKERQRLQITAEELAFENANSAYSQGYNKALEDVLEITQPNNQN